MVWFVFLLEIFSQPHIHLDDFSKIVRLLLAAESFNLFYLQFKEYFGDFKAKSLLPNQASTLTQNDTGPLGRSTNT